MRLTVDGVVYEIDQYTIMNTELVAIERATGLTLRDWRNALRAESFVALTAFVWICRLRSEPLLEFDEVTFSAAGIELDLGDTEPGKGEGTPPNSTDTSSPSPSGSASDPGSSGASSTATPSP